MIGGREGRDGQEGRTERWDRLLFRDYLIGRPDRAREYEALKIARASRLPTHLKA